MRLSVLPRSFFPSPLASPEICSGSPWNFSRIVSAGLPFQKDRLSSDSLVRDARHLSLPVTAAYLKERFQLLSSHSSVSLFRRRPVVRTQRLREDVRVHSSSFLRCGSYVYPPPHYSCPLSSSPLHSSFYSSYSRADKNLVSVRLLQKDAPCASSSASPISPSLDPLFSVYFASSSSLAPSTPFISSSVSLPDFSFPPPCPSSDCTFPLGSPSFIHFPLFLSPAPGTSVFNTATAAATAKQRFRRQPAASLQQHRRYSGITTTAAAPASRQQRQLRALSAAATPPAAVGAPAVAIATATPTAGAAILAAQALTARKAGTEAGSAAASSATTAAEEVKRGYGKGRVTQLQQQWRGIATAAAGGGGGDGTGGSSWTGLPHRGLLNSWHTIATVEKVSATPIRPMTIKRLLQLEPANEASLLKGAEWIREELPVRLSHRLYDFHRLPLVAVAHPLIFAVYESYLMTFDRTRKLPPITSAADLKAFIKIVEKERSTHDRTVDYMGQGVRQLRRVCRDVDLNAFLERFFYFRIGRRVMIDQLVHLQHEQKGWRGIIHLECHAAKVIEQRARDVREACRSTYGIAPPVILTGNTEMRFATIPDHLALIITEILKNALRATVEFHTMGNSLVDASTRSLIQDDEDLPEVKIEVYKGKREVVIKISDKGGGVPPAKLQDMWSFGYSTVTESNTKIQESSSLGPSFIRSDMAGYGFGLPLARAFARYFGGDIHLQSHFGIGTDVYITLNHIGDQEEALYFEERSDLRMGQKLSNETS